MLKADLKTHVQRILKRVTHTWCERGIIVFNDCTLLYPCLQQSTGALSIGSPFHASLLEFLQKTRFLLISMPNSCLDFSHFNWQAEKQKGCFMKESPD